MGADGLAVHPGGADEGGDREIGDAGFVAVDHGDEAVDSGLAGDVVMLVHAGDVGAGGAPFELDDADVGGDLEAALGEPADDGIVEDEEDVGPVSIEPGKEEGGLFAGLVNLKEGRDAAAAGKGFLGGEHAGGKAAIDEAVDDVVDDEGRALVAEGEGLFEGGEGEVVVVGATEREGGVAGADSGNDGGELFPERAETGGELVGVHQAHEEDTADAAGVEDAAPGGGAEGGIVEPELVETVTEFFGAAKAALEIGGNGGVGGEGVGIAVGIDEGEFGLEAGRLAGAELGHEVGDDGVGPVAEGVGSRADAVAGGGGNLGVAAQGEGNGVFGVTDLGSDVTKGHAGHRGRA